MISASEARADQLATELAAEQALRIAAETAQLEAEKRVGYWYRRCEFAETALEELKDAANRWGDPNFDEQFKSAIDTAEATLAERRKGDLPNYEDVIRDRRQTKMLAWCMRAFRGVDDARLAHPRERARRFFEEATELFQAVMVTDYRHSEQVDYAHSEAVKIVDRVLSREPGEISREIGQVAVTLCILAEQHGVSVAKEEKFEFARVLSVPNSTWAARWQAKIDAGL